MHLACCFPHIKHWISISPCDSQHDIATCRTIQDRQKPIKKALIKLHSAWFSFVNPLTSSVVLSADRNKGLLHSALMLIKNLWSPRCKWSRWPSASWKQQSQRVSGHTSPAQLEPLSGTGLAVGRQDTPFDTTGKNVSWEPIFRVHLIIP